jgi:arginine/ornithine N-succinyltransferase beta subunit
MTEELNLGDSRALAFELTLKLGVCFINALKEKYAQDGSEELKIPLNDYDVLFAATIGFCASNLTTLYTQICGCDDINNKELDNFKNMMINKFIEDFKQKLITTMSGSNSNEWTSQ